MDGRRNRGRRRVVDVRLNRRIAGRLRQPQAITEIGEKIALEAAQGPGEVRLVGEPRQALRVGCERLAARVVATAEAQHQFVDVDRREQCIAGQGERRAGGFGAGQGAQFAARDAPGGALNLDLELLPAGGDLQFRPMATVDVSQGAFAEVTAHPEDAATGRVLANTVTSLPIAPDGVFKGGFEATGQ